MSVLLRQVIQSVVAISGSPGQGQVPDPAIDLVLMLIPAFIAIALIMDFVGVFSSQSGETKQGGDDAIELLLIAVFILVFVLLLGMFFSGRG